MNGVLWSRCAKNKFCSKVNVELAVSDTVSDFNSGSASRASLLSIVSNAPPKNMLSTLRKADTRRIKAAANKIFVRARQRRRQLRGEKKAKPTGNSYKSGSFGLSVEAESVCGTMKRKRRQNVSVDKKVKTTEQSVLTYMPYAHCELSIGHYFEKVIIVRKTNTM